MEGYPLTLGMGRGTIYNSLPGWIGESGLTHSDQILENTVGPLFELDLDPTSPPTQGRRGGRDRRKAQGLIKFLAQKALRVLLC